MPGVHNGMNAEPPAARLRMEHQPRRPGYASRSVTRAPFTVNPFMPPSKDEESNSQNRRRFGTSLAFALSVPSLVTLALYLPFRMLASRFNVLTWGDSDAFYYVAATATWPLFAALVAVAICLLATKFGLNTAWHPVLMFVAAVVVLNTPAIDDFFGWNDTGRKGLDYYASGSGFATISTQQLSHYLVIPTFFIAWCVTFVSRAKRVAQQKTEP